MTIKTFVEVASVLPSTTSILLRGDHGIGKSQLVREVAKAREEGHEKISRKVIDRRLAQMTEGDMMGLPSTDGNVTRFNPPDWYVQCCEEPCVLLLDELNRANVEIMQAAFQIVLDRELSGRALHPDTLVFAAINTGASYTVNEVDPALLDRFFVVDLIPDAPEWIDWAQRKNPRTDRSFVNELVVEFIRDQPKFLDTPREAEPTDVTTSRRSWERLSNALEDVGIINDNSHPLFYPICLGYVGTNASIAFRKYAMTFDKTISAEEVLDKFSTKKVQKKLLGPNLDGIPTQDTLNGLIDKVSDYVTTNLDEVTDKQGKNLAAFAGILPAELRLTLWHGLTKKGIEKTQLAISVHKHLCELVLSVFGVPMGEAGVGVTPNIPGVLQNKP